jgi:membrane protease YdiL (CAAX protease family)
MVFGMTLIFIQLYYYINYDKGGFNRETALIYIIIPIAVLAWFMASRLTVNLDKLMLWPMIRNGFIGFMVTWAAVTFVYGTLMGSEFGTVTTTEFWGVIIMQVLFVACSEELAFRYVLPTYLKGIWPRSILIPTIYSSAAFAMFHWGVYQGNMFSLVVAFIMGCIWYTASQYTLGTQKLGLGFTIGSHAAYNLVLVGVLAGNITTISGGL